MEQSQEWAHSQAVSQVKKRHVYISSTYRLNDGNLIKLHSPNLNTTFNAGVGKNSTGAQYNVFQLIKFFLIPKGKQMLSGPTHFGAFSNTYGLLQYNLLMKCILHFYSFYCKETFPYLNVKPFSHQMQSANLLFAMTLIQTTLHRVYHVEPPCSFNNLVICLCALSRSATSFL